MANSYKDIIITPNRSNTADPSISFRGGNTSSNTEVTLRVYPESNGTISFEGSAGQLFSVTNDLTGSIFSVNDVSGIPSIEVFANGLINLAPYNGTVNIGGNVAFSGNSSISAQVFYDSANASFYVDPASTSNINALNSGRIVSSDNTYDGGIKLSTASGAAYISVNRVNDAAGQVGFQYQSGASTRWYNYLDATANNLNWYNANVGSTVMSLDWAAGYLTQNVSVRAPIFYDSANTSFYVDPASGSNLNGTLQNNGGATMSGSWNRNLYLVSTFPVVVFNSNNSKYSGIGVDYTVSDGGFYFWVNGSSADISGTGTTAMTINTGNYVTAYGSFRAPIFYDTANTSFYVDPASSSRLSTITVGDGAQTILIGNQGQGAAAYARIRTDSSGALMMDSKDGQPLYLNWWSGESNHIISESASRFPTYYDRNDTGFYTNPASTSVLNGVQARGFTPGGSGTPYNWNGSIIQYYWTKIANLTGGDAYATLLIQAKNDVNYRDYSAALLTLSKFNNSSLSVKLDALTSLDIEFKVRVDNNNDVWLQTVNAQWNSSKTWTIVNQIGSPTIYYTGLTETLTTPANSVEILPGQHITNVTQGSASGATVASTSAITFGGVASRAVMTRAGNTVWDAGNDGSGSGLDADLLDGSGWTSGQNVIFGEVRGTDGAFGNQGVLASGYPFTVYDSQRYLIALRNSAADVSHPWIVHDDWNGAALIFHFNGIADRFRFSEGGIGQADADWRAPIFYDSANTSFYVDPASTSVLSILNIPGQQAINTTTPGTTTYNLNFVGQSVADNAQAITWSWSGSGAQAGIYVQSSGGYGTKMYLATTDSFATGSKTAISIDHSGITNFVRATPTVTGNAIWHAGNDGSGSGLDADLLDGISSGSFLRNDTTNLVTTFSNRTRWYSANVLDSSSGDQASLEVFNGTAGEDAFMTFHVGGDFAAYFGLAGDVNDFCVGGWSMGATKYRVWHSGNDGSGSGLDADLLDGVSWGNINTGVSIDGGTGNYTNDGTLYITATNNNDWGLIVNKYNSSASEYGVDIRTGAGATYVFRTLGDGAEKFRINGAGQAYYQTSSAYWHAANDGSGSGLDADLLDGNHASAFLLLSGGTMTGDLSFASSWLLYSDTSRDVGNAVYYPNSKTRAVRFSFADAAGTGTGGNFSGVMHFHPWDGTTASTGDASYQLAFGSSAVNGGGVPILGLRKGIDTTWNSWYYLAAYGVNYKTGILYATQFVDSDSTGFLIDPASTSNINQLNGNGKVVFETTDSYLRINQSSGFSSGVWFGSSNILTSSGYIAAGSNGGTTTSRVYINSGTYNGTNVISLDGSNGNIVAAGNITASSDERLKDNFEEITSAIDKVKQIRGLTFTRVDMDHEKRFAGVIAQEVEKVLPEVVSEDSNGYKAVAYGNMVGLLIEAIKEQQKQIEELKAALLNK